MISLKNKGLKNQKDLKLCKMHKTKRSRICRNGKVRLDMTKVDKPRNFRVLRSKLNINYGRNRVAAEKVEQRR